MSNDLSRYLELIVGPTFDEFKRNPTSIRHAFLACVVIYHAIDRAAYPGKPGNLLKEWRKQSLEFKLVEIVANHFKHVESSDEKASGPGIPIAFALGLSDSGETMELRNFFFVIRDAIKFLHQQAKPTVKRNALSARPRARGKPEDHSQPLRVYWAVEVESEAGWSVATYWAGVPNREVIHPTAQYRIDQGDHPYGPDILDLHRRMGTEMAKKITRNRPWTEEEVRMLKTLAREKTKATVIASKLNRSYAATRVKASALGVSLGGGRGRQMA